jgi:hypothetical protein
VARVVGHGAGGASIRTASAMVSSFVLLPSLDPR